MLEQTTGQARSAADRLFAVVDTFDRPGARTAQSLTEIAASAELPLSTAHRLVKDWTDWGGLVRGEDGLYRLGMRLWRLGARAPVAARLRVVARPFLEDLYELTRENVHLAVRDGLSALYLERFSHPLSVPVISEVGTALPLHATGVGLVLLASAPPEVFGEVIAAGPTRFLPGTVTDEEALRSRLAEVRARGYATSLNEMTQGSYSVAAPIRDRTGDVVAAVSVVGRAAGVDDPQVPLAVRLAARGISSSLGWRS